MAHWPIPAKTAADQLKASSPASSAWVHANAGSGKTHVLAQRVVRLLLAGAEPSKILCLTFTKAAAANMSMRVFSILSKWTEYDDIRLREEIRAFGGSGDIKLEDARRLFARAVETPGGLKIQTIHAFCERILHLFPFEANVPSRFEAVDDERQALLMDEAREYALMTAINSPESPLGQAVRLVALEASGKTFGGLLKSALNIRATVRAAADLQSERFERELAVRMGLGPNDSLESITREILTGGISTRRWSDIVEALELSGGNDAKVAARYRLSHSAADEESRLSSYLDIFLTGKGEARQGRLVKKSIDESIAADIEEEKVRTLALLEKIKSARIVRRSAALQKICDEILSGYARLKQAQNLLDFDDLIERMLNLFTRSDAGWVLYKLDAGIDHILVDEAQDTSPQQWRILKKLADEFFSGESARTKARTFFAVGDEKQSIFSFQGAAPREFAGNARLFGKQVVDAKMSFENVKLQHSFRSSQIILDAVDKVFSLAENYKGLSIDDEKRTVHVAWKVGLQGLVEIWDFVSPLEKPVPENWRMPVDALSENAPASILARQIALRIRTMLDPDSREAVHDSNGIPRSVRAGDILILVRRRNAFFDAVIRELKVAGVPVAGADRLKLMEHIAVMDLVAAGRAALLPEDELTLACVLKSPFFGFDDDDLLRLAPNRTGNLFVELGQSKVSKDREAFARITAWGVAARDFGPFNFYAQLLGAEGGRRAILARLGSEAGDAIDEFLRLALQWEHDEAASLTAFLHRMQGASLEIKRDMEAAGESVRVMTVHAAKGLEAKIVFMPDTASKPAGQNDPRLIKFPAGQEIDLPVWRSRAVENPEAVKLVMDQLKADQEDEYRRLLYVAMTRAEERLYICGYLGARDAPEGCWYKMVAASLGPDLESVPGHPDGGNVWRMGGVDLLAQPVSNSKLASASEDCPWLFTAVTAEFAPQPPLRPSHVLAAADQMDPSGGDSVTLARNLALLEGNLLHALLQYLPAVATDKHESAAAHFLEKRAEGLPDERRRDLVRQALRVITDPLLEPVFGPQGRAEVTIAGRIPRRSGGHVEIAGRIDRLSETGADVLIVDFKSGRPGRDGKIPPHYMTQMALYRAALAPLFPEKQIRALIVWTSGPDVVELSEASLEAAVLELTA